MKVRVAALTITRTTETQFVPSVLATAGMLFDGALVGNNGTTPDNAVMS